MIMSMLHFFQTKIAEAGGGLTDLSGISVDSQSQVANADFAGLTNVVVDILVSAVIPLIFALAFVVFILGVSRYVWSGGSEDKRKEGALFMTYGIIGLFAMFSVWGLVGLFTTFFGEELGSTRVVAPQLKER